MLSDTIEALKQELEQADGGRLLPATEGIWKKQGDLVFPTCFSISTGRMHGM